MATIELGPEWKEIVPAGGNRIKRLDPRLGSARLNYSGPGNEYSPQIGLPGRGAFGDPGAFFAGASSVWGQAVNGFSIVNISDWGPL